MKNFGIIGVAGFVAPRHLRAIADTGNNLLAALDPFDSVGILDSYFPQAQFYTSTREFRNFLNHYQSNNSKSADYMSICSPNYLHPEHCKLALEHGADAICEKPLALNPQQLDELQKATEDSGNKIWNILQSRLHPSLCELREKIHKGDPQQIYDVDLTYLTSRGHWYHSSWKGEQDKSGGIATNIGVHFFDMLSWIFGPLKRITVHLHQADVAAGYLELKQARVRWFLSLNPDHLPESARSQGKRFYRSIQINGMEIEFSDGFKDLHTRAYERILAGNGIGIEQVRPAIEIVHQIRTQHPVGLQGDYHPMAKDQLPSGI